MTKLNLSDFECEKMNSRDSNVYSSFKLTVPIKNEKDLLVPEKWPVYVVIKPI